MWFVFLIDAFVLIKWLRLLCYEKLNILYNIYEFNIWNICSTVVFETIISTAIRAKYNLNCVAGFRYYSYYLYLAPITSVLKCS